MSKYYKLEGKKAVEITDPTQWALSFDGKNRRVDKTVIGDVTISTVFLGLDHQWENGPPLIFETMIFGGEHDQYQDRYSTWEEAETGHKHAVELVQTGKQGTAGQQLTNKC